MKRSPAPGPRRSRPFRRVLGGAVALGLAVSGGALASPAAADPAEPGTWDYVQDAVMKIAPGSVIVSAGRTGFLSLSPQNDVRWTRYANHATTDLGRDQGQFTHLTAHGSVSDIVALGNKPSIADSDKITLRNMDTGSSALVDLGKYGYRYLGTVEDRVLAVENTAEGETVHILGLRGEEPTDRPVTSMATTWHDFQVVAGAPGKALLRYELDVPGVKTPTYTTIDLATGKGISGTNMLGPSTEGAALSATHMASVGEDLYADTGNYLKTVELGGMSNPKTSSTHLPGIHNPVMGLVGNWVLYGNRGKITEGTTPDEIAFQAAPIGGGSPRKVMDHASSATPTPDGALLVMGGTVAHGEGLYRVSAKTGGKAPAVELVAGAGESTKVALIGFDAPSTVQPEQHRWHPRWKLSRRNVNMIITLRHDASGKQTKHYLIPEIGADSGPGWAEMEWDGLVEAGRGKEAAPNGGYTWEVTAEPRNGLGPTLHETGAFTVDRKPAAHDFTDNGSPDVIVRDRAGRLSLEDTYRDLSNPQLRSTPRKVVGGGWNIYDKVVAVGDVAGASHGDVVARDSAGVLWLYLGKGDGTFDKPLKIGAGWNAYDQITGGSDLNGDGRGDLLARDRSGVLWLYEGTGNWRAPFAPRKKVGAGWNTYDNITAVGDVAGASAGDVVARDRSGVLWLYLGKGDGTFDGRVKIGAGWGGYRQLIGIGDANRGGHADLLVTTPDGASYLYQGTGNWQAPFAPRQQTGIGTPSSETIA